MANPNKRLVAYICFKCRTMAPSICLISNFFMFALLEYVST